MTTAIPIFNEISARIIKEQALIIGPLAWVEARKVPGITVVDEKSAQVTVEDINPQEAINKLVAQYERLFGRLSHEISKEAVHDLVAKLPEAEVPSSVK